MANNNLFLSQADRLDSNNEPIYIVFLRKLCVGFFSNPAIRALRYIYKRQIRANT